MDREEEKRREEENRRFLKRLVDSEAETRTDLPANGKEDGSSDSTATTKAVPPRHTAPPPPNIPLEKQYALTTAGR